MHAINGGGADHTFESRGVVDQSFPPLSSDLSYSQLHLPYPPALHFVTTNRQCKLRASAMYHFTNSSQLARSVSQLAKTVATCNQRCNVNHLILAIASQPEPWPLGSLWAIHIQLAQLAIKVAKQPTCCFQSFMLATHNFYQTISHALLTTFLVMYSAGYLHCYLCYCFHGSF